MTPEQRVKNTVCEYLQSKGLFFFPVNNGATFDQKMNQGRGGYRTPSKWYMKGVPDTILITPPECKYGGGIFVGIEFKKPKGGLVSVHQRLFEKRCHSHNAEYYVIKSLDDAKRMLVDLGIASL